MAKSKKEIVDSPKLYYGTSESLAKLSCVKGISPYNEDKSDFNSKNYFSSTYSCLTEVYPSLLSYDIVDKEKWGIVEIDVSHLVQEGFFPHEGYLLEKTKDKFTSEEDYIKKISSLNVLNSRKKWKESLDEFGMCFYEFLIPATAVSKVVIYNPMSNPTMTRAMLGVSIGSKFHKSNFKRQFMIKRWLMGENVTVEEWVGPNFSKLEHSQKEKIAQVLRNKSGLDIYYIGLPNYKKITWW